MRALERTMLRLKQTQTLIEAAKRVTQSLTEEDMHMLSDHLPGDQGIEFAGAITDLAMAVQELDNDA